MRAAIVAIGADGVIGLDGALPWHYGEDLKRFKRVTLGSAIVMGRKTWEAIGRKPLPSRRNIVISRSDVPDVESYREIEAALRAAGDPCWVIGGADIYRQTLPYCDTLDITHVPDRIEDGRAVRFPPIDEDQWRVVEDTVNPNDERLRHVVMRRIGPARNLS
jgi:dihydrofolate reductase